MFAHKKANIGTSVSFTCNSIRDTRWYFRDITTPPISRDNLLVIDPVELRHRGNYFCFGHYLVQPKHFIARARLQVYGE